jgi:hypothetical protein
MSSKEFILFGSGEAIFIPKRDADGNAIAVPTPVSLSSCIDIGIEKKGDAKKHEGKFQYSIASAIAKRSIEVSLTCNVHSAKSLTLSTNESVLGSFDALYSPKTATLIPATPFTITATPPGTGVFKTNMGVLSDTGEALTRVASAPTTGQYSLVDATGVYTFAAADVGKAVYIKYTYSTSSGGSSVAEYNRMQGEAPEYSLILTSGTYRGVSVMFDAPIVTIKDTSQPFKNGDYMAQKITVDVLANPVTGLVFTSNIPL